MSLTPSKPLDAETQANIAAARTVNGVPLEDISLPFESIGHMLEGHATATPEKIYLIHYDADDRRTAYTYADFNRLVNQTARVLTQKLGVGRGDRVATLGYNHADTAVIYFACWKIGATVAPQNVAEDDQRIAYILRNSGAQVLLARPEYLERARHIVHGEGGAPNVREIVQVGGVPSRTYRHLQTERDPMPETYDPPEPVTLWEEALLVYTSGTTGAPKGVVLQQVNMLADAQGIAAWHGLTAEQRTMCVLPTHHVNGIIVTLVTPMFAGASTVLNRGYSSSLFWKRLADEDVQIVSVVPTLLQFSLEYAEHAEEEGRSIWGEGVTRADLSSFRHFICGAGTLAVTLAAAFEAKFGFPIVHGYGLSETTCYSCFLPVDLDEKTHRHYMADYGYPSIGVPIAPNEMAIFDGQGKKLGPGPGQRGEICIRGHNVMKHYYQRPEANRETFAFGWFRSGDEGFYVEGEDGQPYFFITGRIKELINRGGVKFSPFDIEEVLLEMPQINTALAVGFENDYYGEEVGAYVVLHEGQYLTEREILQYCRQRLTFEKAPKVVVFGEEVPVTSTGKYQRLRLKDQFRRWKAKQFRKGW